jgi:hypothetical protein
MKPLYDVSHEAEMCACLAVCPTTREWAKIMHVTDDCCTHPVTKRAYIPLLAAGWQNTPEMQEMIYAPLGEAGGLYGTIADAIRFKLFPEWFKGEATGILQRFQCGAHKTFALWSRAALRYAAEQMNAGDVHKGMWYIAPIVAFGAAPRPSAAQLWLYSGWRFEDINTLSQDHAPMPEVLNDVLPKAQDMVSREEWMAWDENARYVYEERMGVAQELGMSADEAHRHAASEARIEQAALSKTDREIVSAASSLFNAEVIAIKTRTMTTTKEGMRVPVDITKEAIDG